MENSFEDNREKMKFVVWGIAEDGYQYTYPTFELFEKRTTERGDVEKSYETFNHRCAFFEYEMIKALQGKNQSKFQVALFKWFLVVPLEAEDSKQRRKEAEEKFRAVCWFEWAAARLDNFMSVIHILYDALDLRKFVVTQDK